MPQRLITARLSLLATNDCLISAPAFHTSIALKIRSNSPSNVGDENLRLGLSQPYISLMRRYATDNSRHNHPLRRNAALKLAGRALSPFSFTIYWLREGCGDLRPHRYSSAATCHSTRSPQSNESEHLARLVKLVQISNLETSNQYVIWT